MPWLEVPDQLGARYNIAPSQKVAVVPNREPRRLEFFQWGLVPSWAKDPKIGYRMINARGETLAEKPSFRAAYRRRRCLVIADGFYEWKKEPGQRTKTPYLIKLASGEPFAFAGLWEIWKPDDAALLSCTIVTTEANKMVGEIHDRMPVILPPESHEAWLETDEIKPEELSPLLAPYPAEAMVAHPVSTLVNSPANDTAECIKPVGGTDAPSFL